MSDPALHVALTKAEYSKGTNKGSLLTDPSHIAVRGMLATLKKLGVTAHTIGVPYCTDAPLFADLNIPVVLFAPGSISEGHSPNESIPIRDLVIGASPYALLAMELGAFTMKPPEAGQ